MERVFSYPKLRRFWRSTDPIAWFDNVVVLADWVPGDYTVTGICEDPDDDKYLAAAVEGRATFVISGDHALLAVKQYETIRIVSPRTFLTFLGG